MTKFFKVLAFGTVTLIASFALFIFSACIFDSLNVDNPSYNIGNSDDDNSNTDDDSLNDDNSNTDDENSNDDNLSDNGTIGGDTETDNPDDNNSTDDNGDTDNGDNEDNENPNDNNSNGNDQSPNDGDENSDSDDENSNGDNTDTGDTNDGNPNEDNTTGDNGNSNDGESIEQPQPPQPQEPLPVFDIGLNIVESITEDGSTFALSNCEIGKKYILMSLDDNIWFSLRTHSGPFVEFTFGSEDLTVKVSSTSGTLQNVTIYIEEGISDNYPDAEVMQEITVEEADWFNNRCIYKIHLKEGTYNVFKDDGIITSISRESYAWLSASVDGQPIVDSNGNIVIHSEGDYYLTICFKGTYKVQEVE